VKGLTTGVKLTKFGVNALVNPNKIAVAASLLKGVSNTFKSEKKENK
jgi:hypothetical protein